MNMLIVGDVRDGSDGDERIPSANKAEPTIGGTRDASPDRKVILFSAILRVLLRRCDPPYCFEGGNKGINSHDALDCSRQQEMSNNILCAGPCWDSEHTL